jgi:hypothetical protein
MSSSPRSEKRAEPLELDRDLPRTPADRVALRRPDFTAALDPRWLEMLSPPDLFGPWTPRRETAAGRRPFEL